MKIATVQTSEITSFIGVRAMSSMAQLGDAVSQAFRELTDRRSEIRNLKDPNVTYGITPPNYKGSEGQLDFYCCHEVDEIANVPHGMVHIHLLPRLYSVTYYTGSASRIFRAYDFTSAWLEENGYAYDDVSYYYERYDEKTLRDTDDASGEVQVYCPIKKIR